jgi:hypothetical protein
MPEPGGFSQSTLAASALYSARPAAQTLFFDAMSGRSPRRPGQAFAIILGDLRAKGQPVTAADLMPEAHRLDDAEREAWEVIAAALAAASSTD